MAIFDFFSKWRPFPYVGFVVRAFGLSTKYSMVFVTVINLVSLCVVVSIICKFEYFARYAWKCLFMPLKWGFFGDTPQYGSSINATPKKALPCAEKRHMT